MTVLPKVSMEASVLTDRPTAQVREVVVEGIQVPVVDDIALGNWTVRAYPDYPGLSLPPSAPGKAYIPVARALSEPRIAPALLTSLIRPCSSGGADPSTHLRSTCRMVITA